MSNLHYTQFLKTIAGVYDEVKQKGVICLESNAATTNGEFLDVKNQKLVNFGSCGYLGLEKDFRIVNKSIEYTVRYGSQFAISRMFMALDLLRELEDKLSEMFEGSKVFTFSSTSLAHIAVLPIVVGSKDAIILDKQVHFSVQNAARLVSKDVPVRMIKHSNMAMLEQYIQRLKNKHDKIWYLADGVYSMFGDIAPIDELNELMGKYEQLHLYIDDAHGSAWCGSNGSGSVFDKVKYKDRFILSTTNGKAFGSIGGMAIFPNHSFYEMVQKFGGPLSYSHPLPPNVMGATTASAELLVTEEGAKLQAELKERIDYCNLLLQEAGLPILSNVESTIKFLAVGELETGYKLNKKMIDEGFYVNMALFPAVPLNETGMRFSLNRHISMENIKRFVELLDHHYYNTLKEENTGIEEIHKLFKLPARQDSSNEVKAESRQDNTKRLRQRGK